MIDVDGDAVSDMNIRVTNTLSFFADDFLL